MKPEDYQNSPAGRLVQQSDGTNAFWAFVPNPLPPKLDFEPNLVRLLSDADRALGELAGLGHNLENAQLLMLPLRRREAVLSSRIEGTQTGIAGLYAYEAGQMSFLPDDERPASEGDAREVLNYVRALEYGIERVKSLPVSLRLMRELHEKLMAGARGEHMTIGQFRQFQNLIGRRGDGYAEASYVPPPVPEMKAALDELEKYLHDASDLGPPLVRLAFFHYQFEAIHPFMDGNGRIGRLLLALLLVEWGLLPLPLLYLSAYFEHDRGAYYGGLSAVSRVGAWQDWVEYFLKGVREQSLDAASRLRKLADLRRGWHQRLARPRVAVSLLRAVDYLFERPIVTIPMIQAKLELQSYRGAKLNVEKLIEAEILQPIGDSKYSKTYYAAEILSILS